jgi:D-arabinose 1-dehydrogenase-like Zn-dependent alcohol dehydrogenase
MRAAAVCGSDLHGYRAPREKRPPDGQGGIIPGHELSGVVHSIGEGVTGVHVGDRVAVYHYRGCGHCQQCRAGRLMWCAQKRGYGGPIHGSDADLLVTDARNCLPLPDDFSFAAGALLMCVAGTAYEAMRKLDASGRGTLAIFGLGPVGLTGLLMARAMGAQVVGIDVSPERLALASRLGAQAVVDAAHENVVERFNAGRVTRACRPVSRRRGPPADNRQPSRQPRAADGLPSLDSGRVAQR